METQFVVDVCVATNYTKSHIVKVGVLCPSSATMYINKIGRTFSLVFDSTSPLIRPELSGST